MGACASSQIVEVKNRGRGQKVRGGEAKAESKMPMPIAQIFVAPRRERDGKPSKRSFVAVERTCLDSTGGRKRMSLSGRSFVMNNTLDRENATPAAAFEELMNGNTRFILGESDHPNQDFKRLQAVAPKQNPTVAILACADSRVPTEIIFDVGFGDMFVCRIAGNIATSEQIGSLEYAVMDLGVKVLMVMGHTCCGAVKAALSGKAFPGSIVSLLDNLAVAIMQAQTRNGKSYEEAVSYNKECGCMGKTPGSTDPDMIDHVIRENVLHQVVRCKRSIIISEAINAGTLMIVPAIYDIMTGEVMVIH